MSLGKLNITAKSPELSLLADADRLGLTAQERAYLREADRLRNVPPARKDYQSSIKRARRYVNDVRAAIIRRASISAKSDQARAELAAFEATIAHEKTSRGGEDNVSKFNPAGAVRIKDRDGLQSMFDQGRITAVQLSAGMLYRAVYEIASKGLGSQLGGEGSGGGLDLEQMIIARLSDAEDAMMATRIEQAVDLQSRALKYGRQRYEVECDVMVAGEDDESLKRHRLWSAPREVVVLRGVAGEGRCINEFASGGNKLIAYRTALCTALTIAALELRLIAPVDGRTGESASRRSA